MEREPRVMIVLHTEQGTVVICGEATFIEDPWDDEINSRNPELAPASAINGWAVPTDPATAADIEKSTVVAVVDLDAKWVAEMDQLGAAVYEATKKAIEEANEE